MTFFSELGNNTVFGACFVSWFVAQLIKVVLTFVFEKRVDVTRFVGSGGMPSSHSSFVTSLATGVGIEYGFDSSVFALALVFALIVMYDAAGVRRAVGKQAKIINAMVEDLQAHKPNVVTEKRLKELVGHTPVEVFFGAILGIVVANLMI